MKPGLGRRLGQRRATESNAILQVESPQHSGRNLGKFAELGKVLGGLCKPPLSCPAPESQRSLRLAVVAPIRSHKQVLYREMLCT